MESNLPNYIQKRINHNLKRVKEIKEILKDFDDDMESLSLATELYEEISFLIKENMNLMSVNHQVQTYEEPIYQIEPDNVDIKVVKSIEDKIDYSVIDINMIAEKTGAEKEQEAKEIFGVENLYQIVKNDENDYIEEDDMVLFTRYGITFANGLAVNIDVDNTPQFVLERIRRTNVYTRLLNGKTHNSDVWSQTDKIEKIYFESEITDKTFKDIGKIDVTVEDKEDVKEYKNKKFVLLQMKPDYAISNDYRYTIIEEWEDKSKFNLSYTKLKDKSEEFGIPTYAKK